MKSKSYLTKFLLLSILINIMVFLLLSYICCVKTDLCKRVLSNLGLICYDSNIVRHQIEYRCLEGWSNCLSKQGVKTDIVFYGNSITYESDFQQYFSQFNICNLGCNRDDLDDLIHRAFIIQNVQPRKIFVLGGINRLTDVSLEEFKLKYAALVDTIRMHIPAAQLYLQSMLPVNVELEIGARYDGCVDKIKKANEIIKEISNCKSCTYVDLYSAYQEKDTLPRIYTRDGLHLNPEAYSIWAHIIKPYVEQ